MNQISKMKFMDALIAAGYQVAYENGMPIALCDSADEIVTVTGKIKALAKENGYNESLGVRVSKASEKTQEGSNELQSMPEKLDKAS